MRHVIDGIRLYPKAAEVANSPDVYKIHVYGERRLAGMVGEKRLTYGNCVIAIRF